MTDKNIRKKSLDEAKKQSQEYLAGWQRAKADYANLQKETERRLAEIANFTTANLVFQILPVYDNLKSALNHAPIDDNWAEGINHIKKQLEVFLNNLGTEEIRTLGEKFNPEMHEAVVHEEKEGFEKDIIFEEVLAGYKMDGKVLRPARVKVAK